MILRKLTRNLVALKKQSNTEILQQNKKCAQMTSSASHQESPLHIKSPPKIMIDCLRAASIVTQK